MNEDEDEVVREIPVYVSQTLTGQLFIYQYPTKSAHSSGEDADVIRSCIKPQLQEVELELSIDTNSANYDSGRGEQIAINSDGVSGNHKAGEEPTFPSGKMDHLTLKSSRLLHNASNYAVGVLNEGELHLTPLTGIVSLRPSFSYLDKSDKRQSQSQDDLSGGEEEEELQQVKVKFARQENERAKKAREQSYDYHNRLSSSEPWYQTNYSTAQSDEAELERTKLYCPQLTERVAELSLSSEDYLNQLIDPDAVDESTSGATKRSLKTMNLADQIRHVLKEARLLPFRQLISLLPQPVDLQNILRTVQTVGVLVRGNWVVRSDIVYARDTFSASSGVPAEIMCRSRDYVLHQFTQHKYVDRLALSQVVKLPTAELLEILSGVAVLRRKKGWELQLQIDRDFIDKYPDLIQRQEMWWDAKQRQLNESFRLMAQTPPTSPNKRGSRSGSRRRDSSFSSDGEGRTNSGRQRRKSSSQPTLGLDQEPMTNGISNEHSHPGSRKKSSSISNDIDSAVNNNSDHSTVPQKRTKRNSMEESLSS